MRVRGEARKKRGKKKLTRFKPRKKETKMTAEIKNGNLVITIPMNPVPTNSASGKTKIVASSHGNIATTATVDGKPVIIGCNAYIRN